MIAVRLLGSSSPWNSRTTLQAPSPTANTEMSRTRPAKHTFDYLHLHKAGIPSSNVPLHRESHATRPYARLMKVHAQT